MKVFTSMIPAGVLAIVLVGMTLHAGCGGGGSMDTSAAASGNGTAGRSDSGGGGSTTAGAPMVKFRAKLIGFQEVPAISTTGHGTFEASSDDGKTFSFTLTYADLEGNAGEGGAVTGAHVHLGQRGVAGGVAVNLCGAGGLPACPAPPATVTGTFTAAEVVGPSGQGIAAGELSELLAAARAGVTYVNVHTTAFPTGEIRGQIRAPRGDGEHDDGHDDEDD